MITFGTHSAVISVSSLTRFLDEMFCELLVAFVNVSASVFSLKFLKIVRICVDANRTRDFCQYVFSLNLKANRPRPAKQVRKTQMTITI